MAFSGDIDMVAGELDLPSARAPASHRLRCIKCLGGLLLGGAAIVPPAMSSAHAQSASGPNASTLPPITVEAPRERPRRAAQRERSTPRAVQRRVARPEPAPAGAIPLGTIEVQGERAGGPVRGIVATRSATGTKTDTPLLETPQSISVVTRRQIEEQGAQTVSEALRTTPGVVAQWSGYDVRYDYMLVRGFQPTTFLNGLILPTGFSSGTHGIPQVEPYGLERIEVLRGAASALYGQVPPGGILNMVSKRPTDVAFGEIQLQTGSFARKQAAFDIGGPVTQDGSLLYRLTGLGRLADTQINFQDEKRVFIAPSFTWRPTADTTFTFLSSYMNNESGFTGAFLPAAGTLLPNPNGRLPRSLFPGEKNYDNFKRELGTIGYSFEHRFNDIVSFTQNLQYAFSNTDSRAINVGGWADANQTLLRRGAVNILNNGHTFTIDNQLKLKLNTGPVSHTILAGVDYQNFKNEFWYRGAANAPVPLNAYNPVYTGFTPTSWITTNHTNQSLSQLGAYVQDQIRYDRWLLTLTGRHDSTELGTFNHVNGATTNRVDNAFSGRAGLNYVFDSGLSPYISYATSFQPVVGTNKAGETFAPTIANQIEAGIKYQPNGSPIFAALSVFDLTRTNITTADAYNNGFLVQSGEARVRGVEMEVKARLFDTLDLTAAYAYSESEVTKSNDTTVYNGAVIRTQGKELPFVPRHQASLWANYTFAGGAFDGLSLGAGVRYVGALYGDNANLFKSPDTAFFDLAAAYDLGKLDRRLDHFHLRVNLRNVFDTYYVTCTSVNACYPAEGRTALATLTYKW